MRKYLLDKKEDIKSLEVVKQRLVKFPETKNFIITIIGPRRAGKTYSLYDFLLNKKVLKDEEYLFINLEDEGIQLLGRDKISKSISYHEEIYGAEPKFIFLDEVQALDKWERFVYTIFEKKRYHIFITGSSSKLLSKEIATQLRGRSTSVTILPLSFREYLLLKGLEVKRFYSTREENKMKNILLNYLKLGGFPDVAIGNIHAKRFFKDYVDLVVFKDLVERFNIRNVFLMKFLVNSALASFGKDFSIHKVYTTLKSRNIKVSKKTLYSYSTLLEDVMFSFFLQKFSSSLREAILSLPKVYINDPGLVNNTLLVNFSENIGRLMENVAFLELKRMKNENPLLEFYYWKDYQQREVDFVIKEGSKINQIVQITYASGRDEIASREVKALLKASEELKCNNLLVITWDYEEIIKVNNKTIKCIPLWKWLLGSEVEI
ncbi:MAG: ATP-binding protein [Methanosarcinales archaeon]